MQVGGVAVSPLEERCDQKCFLMFFNLLQMFISEREDCWTEVAAPERQRGSATRWHPNDAINGHNVCQGITALAITLCLPACISDTEPPACCSMLLTLVG